MRLLCLLFMFFATAALAQQDSGLQRMDTRDAGRGWEAVGRLDIVGEGYCTGTLVDPSIVLTAAHCVMDDYGNVYEPEQFNFMAGYRLGQSLAERSVRRVLPHPSFDANDRNRSTRGYDLALIELSQPIRHPGIRPAAVRGQARRGVRIGVVSYGRGRDDAPSFQRQCSFIDRYRKVSLLTCDIEPGSSGSPVFVFGNSGPRIVSVVSALAVQDGEKIALAADLMSTYDELRGLLARKERRPAAGARVVRPGDRSATGARVVRPGG